MVQKLRVQVHPDHLAFTFPTLGPVTGFAEAFVVPFSTVERARATVVELPGFGEHWLGGIHIPGFIARGRFLSWGGRRRFWWADRRSRAMLRLELRGHTEYDEVFVDVPDPEGIVELIERARPGLAEE